MNSGGKGGHKDRVTEGRGTVGPKASVGQVGKKE